MSLQISVDAARNLRLLALDVDGVLTDGRLYYGADGEMLKAFHTQDGHGLKLLADSGVTIALITGRRSQMVSKRATELGISHVIQGREDKAAALSELAHELGLTSRDIAYVGDDQPDVGALQWAGLSFAPSDAHVCAKEAADHTTTAGGGNGAVREICDAVLAHRELV